MKEPKSSWGSQVALLSQLPGNPNMENIVRGYTECSKERVAIFYGA